MLARRLVGWSIAGLLVVVMAAACSPFGPELSVQIENEGRKAVTVTVESSGSGNTDGEDVSVPVGTGVGWSVPLGSTWEVRIDGRHVIGSGDRNDLLPSAGRRQDVRVIVRIGPDGTMKLQACLDDDYVDGRCTTE